MLCRSQVEMQVQQEAIGVLWLFVSIRMRGSSGFGEVGLAYGKGWRAGFGIVQDFAEVIIGEDPMNIEKNMGDDL